MTFTSLTNRDQQFRTLLTFDKHKHETNPMNCKESITLYKFHCNARVRPPKHVKALYDCGKHLQRLELKHCSRPIVVDCVSVGIKINPPPTPSNIDP